MWEENVLTSVQDPSEVWLVCIIGTTWEVHTQQYNRMSRVLVAVLLCLFAARAAGQGDVTWYVAPWGYGNGTQCGRNETAPCDSLQTLLSQYAVSSEGCYQPRNVTAVRSTTVYFSSGVNVEPATLCISNWTNLALVGRDGAAINSTAFPYSGTAFLKFINCLNVSIEGLNFLRSFIGSTTVVFTESSSIVMKNCVFPIIEISSTGVEIIDSSGTITIDSVLLYSGETDVNTVPAFRISQSNGANPFNITINNSTFRDILRVGKAEDSYSNSRGAVALRINLKTNVTGNTVVVQNSTFTRLQNTASDVVGVLFDTSSFGNIVRFIGCEFRDNTARYGGGVSAYFWNDSNNNALQIQDCKFINNTATLEGGGVLGVFISEQVDNKMDIQSSTFIGNSATYGAGVFLLNNPAWYDYTGATYNITPPLVSVNISGCTFINNTAPICEGIISLLRVLLYMSGQSTFTGNTGSGILLRLSYAHISDNVTFESNTAENGAAIQILYESRLDLSGVTSGKFRGNAATFSGGAIFADDSSSSVSAVEYTHKLADNEVGPCFLEFGNEFTSVKPNVTRFIFDNNTALSGGQSIQAYSLRSCLLYNFVPSQLDNFFPFSGDGIVQYINSPVLGTTSTGPSFVYFYGASTKCYKPVGNITYLMPNCSNQLLNKTFYPHPGLQCSIQQSVSRLAGAPGIGLGPTTDRLFLPWSGISMSWINDTLWTQCPEPEPAQLVLSPAPGEEFDLTVLVFDQLLVYTSANAYLQLISKRPYTALLQFSGFQYSYLDTISFTPNQPLVDLALVGSPGTEGWLRVVVESQIEGQNIELLLPFQLAQCPMGYYDPPGASTVDEAYALITRSYTSTQRIPNDQPLACQCFSSVRQKFKSTVFNFPVECVQGYTVELSGSLWAGNLPALNSSSIRLPTVTCPAIPINATPYQDTVTKLYLSQKEPESDPVDVVLYDNTIIPGGGAPVTCFQGYSIGDIVNYKSDGPFAVEYCFSSYCQGNAVSTWYLANVNAPCVENREGPLCGSCKPGYALTLYSTSCQNCSNAQIYAPILTTLIVGAVIVIGSVGFDLRLSPTFNSFLFFIQTILVIVAGRTGYASFPQSLAFFNPDFTFNQCITPTLTALERLVLQYVTPLYILFLLMVVLALTSLKCLSKVLGRHSFLQALWLLFMISYFNIAATTFRIVQCRFIGPNDILVLVEDPSVVCYTGAHLAWAIVALIVAIIFVIPFPIYVLILYRIPKYKPITDVYTLVYTDQRRWWVGIDIGRRLVLVLLGVFVQDAVVRNFALLIELLIILLVQMVTWPYKISFHNWFALLVTWMLLIFTCVTQPNLYIIMDPGRYTSWTLAILTISIGAIMVVVETVLRRVYNLTVEAFFNNCFRRLFKKPCSTEDAEEEEVHEASLENPKAYTHYREPLLDANDIERNDGSSILFSRSTEKLSSLSKKVVPSQSRGSSGRPSLVQTTVVSLANGINSD